MYDLIRQTIKLLKIVLMKILNYFVLLSHLNGGRVLEIQEIGLMQYFVASYWCRPSLSGPKWIPATKISTCSITQEFDWGLSPPVCRHRTFSASLLLRKNKLLFGNSRPLKYNNLIDVITYKTSKMPLLLDVVK